MLPKFPGSGRKRPQINKLTRLLHLDKENPRLPEEAQGKSENELIRVLYKGFNLDEIAESMAQNGYFDEEPLVGVPRKLPKGFDNVDMHSLEFLDYIRSDDTELDIIEGNRRLATVKLLLDETLQKTFRINSWPILSQEIIDDLSILPVIVYRKRNEVVPYLGVRHIIGIQKWDSYAKARYIANMIHDGMKIQEVEEQIGDKQGSVIKNYICFKMVEQIEVEYDFDTKRVKTDFSLLLLSIGQGNIKTFLGLPRRFSDTNLEKPVPESYLPRLKQFTSWISGDGNRLPVIKESRDITNYLSHIVVSSEAVDYLEHNWDLYAAFDRSDGEETMLLRYLHNANSKLDSALGVAHRHKTTEVLALIEKCENTVRELLKTMRNPQ